MFGTGKKQAANKSPLTARPLRNAGHSLDREIFNRIMDHVMQPVMIACMFVAIAALEWWRWYFNVQPRPWLWSAVAVAAVVYFVGSFARESRNLARLRLGRDGEQAVGQFLEGLREQGARVFHDFPGDGFNLDHVVVHASGVYVIETKTYSKPARGDVRVVYDGVGVLVNGRAPDRNPISQVQSGAKWLGNLIRESTGRSLPVRPVVVFPGWYVETTSSGVGAPVLAIEPKQLPGIVRAGARIIADSDVAMAALHLSRYARSIEAAQ